MDLESENFSIITNIFGVTFSVCISGRTREILRIEDRSTLGHSTIVVPILHLRKLRHREVDATCSVTQLVSSRYKPRSIWMQSQCSWVNYFIYPHHIPLNPFTILLPPNPSVWEGVFSGADSIRPPDCLPLRAQAVPPAISAGSCQELDRASAQLGAGVVWQPLLVRGRSIIMNWNKQVSFGWNIRAMMGGSKTPMIKGVWEFWWDLRMLGTNSISNSYLLKYFELENDTQKAVFQED